MAKGKQILGLPKGKHLFGTAKVGEKGQRAIAREDGDLAGIKPGDTLLILGDERVGIIATAPDVMNDTAYRVFHKIEDG